jgi:hypothetical protein
MLYVGGGRRGLVVAPVCKSGCGKGTPLTTVSGPCFKGMKAGHGPTYDSL